MKRKRAPRIDDASPVRDGQDDRSDSDLCEGCGCTREMHYDGDCLDCGHCKKFKES
jgi:hypothetical protein